MNLTIGSRLLSAKILGNNYRVPLDLAGLAHKLAPVSNLLPNMLTAREQDLFKLYDSSVGQRDAWGNQAIQVDARVEDEWDSIYVDCQDSTDVDYQDFSYDSSGDLRDNTGGGVSSISGIEGMATKRDAGDARSSGSAAAVPAQSRRGGEQWRAGSTVSSGGSRSALMAAIDAYQAAAEEGKEDEEGREGERKGFDEEDIIDCAIRGRWTFKNNDDPVRRGNFFQWVSSCFSVCRGRPCRPTHETSQCLSVGVTE